MRFQPQPVLEQQHETVGGEDIRLVPRYPEELRGGEAWHGKIAGNGAAMWLHRFQHAALGAAAAVIPQDRRAQHPMRPIQQHCLVHLAG